MKNLTKTAFATALAGATILTIANSTYAVEPGSLRNLRQEIRASVAPTISVVRNEIKTQLKQETQTLRKNIIDQAKEAIKKFLPRRIHGKIAAITGSTLTVTTDQNGTVTVNVLSNTILKRRFGGNSTLSEFRTGDEVAVIGAVRSVTASSSSSGAAATDNSIDARYIRDLSIQKRNTVFVGKIVTLGTDSFTVQTQSRGVQTVHIVTGTTYQEKNKAISFSDLNVGDRVLVKGSIWDRALSDIDAAKIIKLPSVPTAGSSSSDTSAAASSAAASSSQSAQSSSSSVI